VSLRPENEHKEHELQQMLVGWLREDLARGELLSEWLARTGIFLTTEALEGYKQPLTDEAANDLLLYAAAEVLGIETGTLEYYGWGSRMMQQAGAVSAREARRDGFIADQMRAIEKREGRPCTTEELRAIIDEAKRS
jgi:hypothetical protein